MSSYEAADSNAAQPIQIVIIGLSITSSWGNGHATTYRALLKAMAARGNRITFLECDVPWYAPHRDMPTPGFCETHLYNDLDDLKARFGDVVKQADVVIVGSYVQDGINVGRWVQQHAGGLVCFYDIDTPVTLAALRDGSCEYLSPALISGYRVYFSFSGGKALRVLEQEYNSPCARALYCSVDPELYYPENIERLWDLGYLGTYSDDRQPGLEKLMLEAARQWEDGHFFVAGPQYPPSVKWPLNVCHTDHLPPAQHRRFYNEQRFTLNITRRDMTEMGHSPSVRLFEAAACGTPIISDWWDGLDELFTPGEEIAISESAEETLHWLRIVPNGKAIEMGRRARQKVLAAHTAAHRAAELEAVLQEQITTAA